MNIAIVITANASTDMVPPDMVIVTKGLKKKHFAGQNGKNKIVKKSAIIIFVGNKHSIINSDSLDLNFQSWKTFLITLFSLVFCGQIWSNISLVYGFPSLTF